MNVGREIIGDKRKGSSSLQEGDGGGVKEFAMLYRDRRSEKGMAMRGRRGAKAMRREGGKEEEIERLMPMKLRPEK
jgi:hypothetical protein